MCGCEIYSAMWRKGKKADKSGWSHQKGTAWEWARHAISWIHFGVCFVYIIYMMFCIHTFRLFSWQWNCSSCCCCCYYSIAAIFNTSAIFVRLVVVGFGRLVGRHSSLSIITSTCCWFACAFIIYVNKLLKWNCRLNCIRSSWFFDWYVCAGVDNVCVCGYYYCCCCCWGCCTCWSRFLCVWLIKMSILAVKFTNCRHTEKTHN